jgi:tripartite-type tricarboxylate transporter receptor subunit TctC
MKTCRSTFMRLMMMAAAAVFAAGAAHAQTYPDKPIHVIVPFSPGSATDVTARALSQELSKKLGQPVVIDNRPGAGGTIGAAQVARAAPDGYTLLVHSSGHTVNPSIFANLGYDTQKDLVGISMLAELPNVLVVPPSRGWKSATDLVKAAKDAPGKLSYGSAGAGSGTHMNAEKFRLRAGFEAVHVPYKGPPEALTDIMGDRIDFVFAPVLTTLSLVRDNRVTALAVGSEKRSSVLPDLPTTQEAGYPGSAYRFWVGLLAPAGMPPALVERLNAEIKEALATPELKQRLAAIGADAAPMTAADFNKLIARELVENADLAKEAGLKAQ